jgi:hypothetical protein
MQKNPQPLQADKREPVRIHPCVFETLVKALEQPDEEGVILLAVRKVVRYLCDLPGGDTVEDIPDAVFGRALFPSYKSPDWRGPVRVHPSVFEEIERAFAAGRTFDGVQALDWLSTNQIEDVRSLLDLSSKIKPREYSEAADSKVDVPRALLYHIRALYSHQLNDTADEAMLALLDNNIPLAYYIVKGIGPGDMEHGGFAGRQIAAQLDMENRHRGNRRTNEAPDAQQAEAVYQVPAGKLSKLREIIHAAADVNVSINATMLDEGQEGRIARRAYTNSQVLIHDALRIVREIVGEEKSDGAQTNCAQGPEDDK